MLNRKLKVLVCGSTFGQFYCECLMHYNKQFELVGLLAGKSERSKKCAEKYGIKLYHTVTEIDIHVDIACVVLRSGVMGGKGSEIALKLLEKGINVIQEQPIHYKDVENCIRIAKKQGKLYCIGDLYQYLPAVKTFIETTRLVLKEINPVYMDIGLASQVSYPLIDIISEILPSLKPFKIKNVIRDDGPFHIVTAEIGGIATIFQVHNEVNPSEPDNYMHYLHKITVGTNGGRICLEDTQGPVYWYNKLHFPLDVDLFSLKKEKWTSDFEKVCNLKIDELYERSYGEVFKKEWVKAISENLMYMIKLIDAGTVYQNKYYTKLVTNTRIWHQFTKALGYANLLETVETVDIDIEKIKLEVKKNMSLTREE